ncbi:MAG: serine/threonine protein kinase, partial [Planctomycetes bacterium]|nr:serine/threonine protein kinase [Planctomycetota bacterium]
MEVDPTWLQSLASEDGADLPASLSIRPALAERLLAMHQQRMRRRTVAIAPFVPAAGEDTTDLRRIADVLDPDAAGTKPYYLLGRIGEGGMGIVHLARQRSTGREVAVKAMHPDRSQSSSAYLGAFRQECRITASMEHPHVVPVYDAGADFMVMKRLTGHSLEQRLREPNGAQQLSGAVEALLKVCDALAYAHARGVVHRDLKGDNIMIGDFGEVWVMDWGLAAGYQPAPDGTWLAPPITDRNQMCAGTPMCVAPEVAIADPNLFGPPIDVFMLGGLLYRILCGRYPYDSPTGKESMKKAAKRDFPSLLSRAPAAPFRLVQAAERAMAWDQGDRGSLSAYAADLRTWLHTSGAAAEAKTLV